MNDDKIKDWITVKGNHIPIKEGQSVEEAISERFDNEDEEINLATDNLDEEIEVPKDELVTVSYYLEGFGKITKAGYDKLKERGKPVYIKTEITPDDNLLYARLSKREDIKTAITKTNPLFDTGAYEWTYNCQRCVVALEMRLRGYDVTAKMRLPEDEETIFKYGSSWKDAWKGFQWRNFEQYVPGDGGASARLMEEEMIREGEGARFIISFQWTKPRWSTKPARHVIMGIVENGKVNYYDPQSGKKTNSWKYKCNPREMDFARVDNLHLTDKVSNCVYDKGKQPTRKSVTTGKWMTKEESEEGYEEIQ